MAENEGREIVTSQFATGGDDQVVLGAGDQQIYLGVGDDKVDGGDGSDQLNGGPGNNLLRGGDGDDVFLVHSYAGAPELGQLDDPTTALPDDLNLETGRLDLPVYTQKSNDDILVGGPGGDQFLFQAQMNAREEIFRKHSDSNGTIDWETIGREENDRVGDHWVDSFGVNLIADFDKSEGDKIKFHGHSIEVSAIDRQDINDDGDLESIITLRSGAMGRTDAELAHVNDLIGVVMVDGDEVTMDDLDVTDGVFSGIFNDLNDKGNLKEALEPHGEVQTATVDGETVLGYGGVGSDGRAEIDPTLLFDNPYIDEVGALDVGGVGGGASAPEPTLEMEPSPEMPMPEINLAEEEPTSAPEPVVDPLEVEYANVSDTVRLAEVDAEATGVQTFADFDLDETGEETSYDVLSVEIGGTRVVVEDMEEFIDLVATIDGDGSDDTNVTFVGQDLAIELGGQSVLLQNVAGDLDDADVASLLEAGATTAPSLDMLMS